MQAVWYKPKDAYEMVIDGFKIQKELPVKMTDQTAFLLVSLDDFSEIWEWYMFMEEIECLGQ